MNNIGKNNLSFIIRDINELDFTKTIECIKRSVLITNSKDYPPKIIQYQVENHYTLEWLKRIFQKRFFIIATTGNKIIGTGSLNENELLNIFVDPDYQGLGVGKRLVFHLEHLAQNNGFKQVILQSSISAKGFYLKLGYTIVNEEETVWLEEILTTTKMLKNLV